MEFSDKDPVWKLLGEAPPRRASGAFVQNTLRRVLQLPEKRSWLQFLFAKPFFAVAAAAAAVVVCAFLILSGGAGNDENLAEAPQPVPAAPVPAPTMDRVDILTEELVVMTYVDELLLVSNPDELDDEALAEILFSL